MIWFLIIFFMLIVVLCIISAFDMNRFVVRKYNIISDKINKPVKAVFLTDLHNKQYGKNNKYLIQKIKEIDPDFILCGGDMIVASPGKDNTNAVRFLGDLAEEYKVYYALGNHEYRANIYPEKYGDMYELFFRTLSEKSVVFLRNQSIYVEDGNLSVSGIEIDRKFYKRFRKQSMEEGYIDNLKGERKKNAFQIMLAHNPDYFKEYAESEAELILSGHLHGGIVRLPIIGGCVSPAIRIFPKYSDGLYRIGKKQMIVSCGLGSHTIPLRIFNPGELSVISFLPE